MEPMLPEEAAIGLEERAITFIAEADRLAERILPELRKSVGDLIRTVNSHYSNLIEGRDTPPRDIDRALAGDFSSEPHLRDLQKEALAHIRVQRLIDEGRDPANWPATTSYARWLHEQFCERLPEDMLEVRHPATGQSHAVVPGQLRRADVIIGRHVPPRHADLPRFLTRFDKAYASPPLSRMRQIQVVGAVHHRFL